MKFSFSALLLIAQLGGHAVQGFTSSTFAPNKQSFSALQSTPSDGDMDPKRMQEILKEEATNPTNMKAAAEAMKNIKAEDMTKMIEEMDNMNPLQKGALKAMGMDPEMMKKTMGMMRDNPQMVESAQKLMQNMTPEQLLEQSRAAQQKMATMTPEEMEQTSKVVSSIPKEQLDQAVEIMKEQQEEQNKPAPASVGPKSDDPDVIDSMFKVGELLSEPATGDVTFAGFASVPVIQLLSGDREFDLAPAELKECWNDGSLGATRVDRAGFERVWNEVQEYFEDDIMGEARREAKNLAVKKKSRPGSTSSSTSSPAVTIGDGIEADQLKAVNEQVKNMSDSDVDNVLDQMKKMGPAEEARMRAMGVDPAMMKKTAELMKSNPMMKKAAQTMMKNMTPEQMLNASKQAQEQMKGMSQEDMEKALNDAAMASPPKQD